MGSVLGNLERISFFVCGRTVGKFKAYLIDFLKNGAEMRIN
jgi:hypothetical protein